MAVAAIVAMACAEARPPAAATGDAPGAPTTLTLRPGETVAPAGLAATVTLTDVRDDSRCPAGADCVWAGDVTVMVDVAPDGGGARTLTLHLANDDARTGAVAGRRVHLDSVAPAPRAGQAIPREDYRVTLAFSRQ